MIGTLRGMVIDRSVGPSGAGLAVVEVAGVGYEVLVTPRALAELEPTATAFLYVHHHIREDAQVLYGFPTREERDTFRALLGAHGVGPAVALAILATHSPVALADIVASADLASLTLVPGIGKKTAERLLVELKSRLSVPALNGSAPGEGGGVPAPLSDVRDALLGLGYAAEEIRDVLRDLPSSADAATLLRQALQVLGAQRA